MDFAIQIYVIQTLKKFMNSNHTLQNIYKLSAFALPISVGALLNMVTSFIAMMMVAKIGKSELAAGALAMTTYITILTIVSTIFYAVSILIGHYKGQGKAFADIGKLTKNGIWLAVLLAVPAALLLWNADHILLLFKQDPHLVLLTRPYFHFAMLSIFPMLINTVIYQFHTGIGKANFTLKVSIINLPIIVLLSYGLVLGKFHLPQLGLGGVTCATFIVQCLLCIALLIYLSITKENKKYAIFSNGFWPDFALCKRIFFLGLPIGIQFGAELAAMTVTTYFMGYFGVIALASSQIVSQYNMLIVMIALGLSQALSILISEAYGKKQVDLVKQYIASAIMILVIFFIFIFALFLFAPHALIKLYLNVDDVNDQTLIHLATVFFSISGITMLIDSIRNILSGVLRGLHDSKAPMRIGVLCLWLISLPVSYVVAFTFNLGPVGLRIGFISGFLIASFLLWQRIKSKLHFIINDKKVDVVNVALME